jgi:hypothetical protein
MSLKNYSNWMKLDESLSNGGSFQFLAEWVSKKGISSVINYGDILNDPAYKENEGGILNEINFFERLLDVLDKDAREVSKLAEDLVSILLQGSNSNTYGEADTIFSDVTLNNGEKVSVKASKDAGFNKVLTSSRIKSNQILSIVFTDGISAVSDKQKDEYFGLLADPVAMEKVKPNGSYSIAACYKKGPDFIVEKTNAVSGEELKKACMNNLDKIKGDAKGRLSGVEVIQNVLGFKPSSSFTYTIKGISGSDIAKLAAERKIILKAIENLPTVELRNIASEYHLK